MVAVLAAAGILAWNAREQRAMFTQPRGGPATVDDVVVIPYTSQMRRVTKASDVPKEDRPPPPALTSAPTPVAAPAPAAPSAPSDPGERKRERARRILAFIEQEAFLQNRIAEGQQLGLQNVQDLVGKWTLTPEEATQLAVLLTEKRIAPTEVAIARLKEGVVPDVASAEFKEQVFAARRKTDEEIRALIGEARFREFEDYFRVREEANTFTRLDRHLANTPDELTPPQVQQLQQALRRENTRALSPAVIDMARGFLSPAQVRALEAAYRTQESTRLQRFSEALPLVPSD